MTRGGGRSKKSTGSNINASASGGQKKTVVTRKRKRR